MYFNGTLEKLDAFPDEGVEFKFRLPYCWKLKNDLINAVFENPR